MLGHIAAILVEAVAAGCFHAIDAVAHLDAVEVDLHDALLAPYILDEHCEIGLKALAHPAVSRPQKHVLGRLLADGAGAALPAAAAALEIGAGNLLGVEAVVLEKTVVFAGHDSLGQVVRHLAQGHPLVVDFGRAAVGNLLHATQHHERRVVDWNVLERHHGQYGRGEEEDEQIG